MAAAAGATASQILNQWRNPSDILSLLLLVGGEVVQKALAQLVGTRVPLWPSNRKPSVRLAPVAFSFGWVAYAFLSLEVAFGEKRLMPEPDCPSIVVNCSNGYARDNRSWVLGRVLRDHEMAHEVDPKEVSLRIDIFRALRNNGPDIDRVCVLGWFVIVVQHILAALPWIIWGYWPIFMVTACGTMFSILTIMIPQWEEEKWAGRGMRLGRRKTVCLTRGNGHHHAMIIISDGCGWDIEALAAATLIPFPETPWIMILLSLGWTMLLITVSGLKDLTWFLIGIGGIGMLQNLYMAGSSRSPGAFNIHLEPYAKRPTIVASSPWDRLADASDSEEEEPTSVGIKLSGDYGSQAYPIGVAGALMALENELPSAGASLLTVFFPSGLDYNKDVFRYKSERKFWKAAFRRIGKPAISSKVNEKP